MKSKWVLISVCCFLLLLVPGYFTFLDIRDRMGYAKESRVYEVSFSSAGFGSPNISGRHLSGPATTFNFIYPLCLGLIGLGVGLVLAYFLYGRRK